MTAAGHLVKCLVLKKGIEGALPLLVIQGLEELLDGGGYLGLCGDGGAGGGDCTEQAATRAPPAPAARAAHAVAEVLQPIKNGKGFCMCRLLTLKQEEF